MRAVKLHKETVNLTPESTIETTFCIIRILHRANICSVVYCSVIRHKSVYLENLLDVKAKFTFLSVVLCGSIFLGTSFTSLKLLLVLSLSLFKASSIQCT